MKKVCIIHQYLDKSHFQALYFLEENKQIVIKDYIAVSIKDQINAVFKGNFRWKIIKKTVKGLLCRILKIRTIKNIRDCNVILGFAPYDPRLLKVGQDLHESNNLIYFSSWSDWSGKHYAQGTLKDKEPFERFLSERIHWGACVTEEVNKGLASFIQRRKTVYHAVDTGEYRHKIAKNTKTKLLFLGRFVKQKNIGMILEWLETNPHGDFSFSFAGACDLRCLPYLGRIKVLEKADYIGTIQKEKIKQILCEYDFLVLPSSFEPFGIVLIEALSAGVPCIVSDVVAHGEVIKDGENGLVFRDRDSSHFNSVLDRAISMGKEEYMKMSIVCLQTAKQYDVRAIATRWEKMLI